MEYRMDYFIRMISKIVGWGTGFIMIGVLLNKFNALGGWSTYEVIFLYALNVFCYSIAATFTMGPFSNLEKNIQLGEFDEVLIRPVNPLFYYASKKVSAGYTSNYILCIGLFILCIKALDIQMTPLTFLLFVVHILGGVLIHAAGFMMTCIPAFWFVKSRSIHNLFYKNMDSFLDYPITIYSKTVQVLLTFVLPYAFINFYPAQQFLGKGEQALFHPILQFLTPIIGIFLFILSYIFWTIGINSYKSTGS
jgi:ABC-2 type transport system permease protein